MMLCFAYAAAKNERFHSAYTRTLKDRQALQARFKTMDVDGRFNTLGFVIADHPLNYFKIVPNVDDSIYQVVVGYDLNDDYHREQDGKVIRMMAGWLRRVFQEIDGYAAKRIELLKVVSEWEKHAVRRLPDGPMAGT